jgi:two-component system, NtrC family, response regulator GlrR
VKRFIKDESDRLENFRNAVENEFGYSFISGSSQSMRESLLQAFESVMSNQNLFISGELGSGRRTLARALKVFFPKHELLEIDCGNFAYKLFRPDSGFEFHKYFENIVSINNHTSETPEKILLLLNLDKIKGASGKFKTIFAEQLIDFLKYKSGAVFVIVTGLVQTPRWLKSDRHMKPLMNMINPFIIKLLPLGNRKDDILLFARYFMQKAAANLQKLPFEIDRNIEKSLLEYGWPGNLYELEMVIKRGILLSQKGYLDPGKLFQNDAFINSGVKPFRAAKNDFERQYMIDILLRTHGNVSLAAMIAKKERKDFNYLLKKHHLELHSSMQ